MLQRLFLLFFSGSVAIVALIYGVSPQWFANTFLSTEGALDTDFANILRAIMGFYLVFAAFWFFAAFSDRLRNIAVLIVALFTGGMAAGRILSMLIDGKPSTILSLYVATEIGTALIAIWLYRRGMKET